MCSLQSLPPPSSTLASFPTVAAPGDISLTHSPGNGDIGARPGASQPRAGAASHPLHPGDALGCPFSPPPGTTLVDPHPASWSCAKGRPWQGLLFIFIIITPPQTQAWVLEGGRRAPGLILCAGAEGCARPRGVDVLP